MTLETIVSVINVIVSLGWVVLMCALLGWIQKVVAAAERREEEKERKEEAKLKDLENKIFLGRKRE